MKNKYHYTSIENWKRIKKEGLKIYPMERVEKDLKGIFLWRRKLKGVSHTGAIIYQMGIKNSEEVVLLEITCEKKGFELIKNCGKYDSGDTISVRHKGKLGDLDYHKNEKGILYFKNIPIKDIKLLKTYKLKNAFK